MRGNYLSFLLEPVYNPNQAAPAPTTIDIKPDCSNVGASSYRTELLGIVAAALTPVPVHTALDKEAVCNKKRPTI